MFMKAYPTLCLLLSIFIFGAHSDETPPTWQPTNLIQAGTHYNLEIGVVIIVTSSNYQQANKLGPYTVIYSTAFTSAPYSGLGIVAIDANPSFTFL
jgi:hypothetical protein